MSNSIETWPRFTIYEKIIATTTGTTKIVTPGINVDEGFICRASFKNYESANTILFEWGLYWQNQYIPLNSKSCAAGITNADIGEFIVAKNKRLYVIATASSGTMTGSFTICGAQFLKEIIG